MLLLLAVLLIVAGALIIARRAKEKRRRAAELKAARLRALRKPSVPFVSSSLCGSTTNEPAKPRTGG
jgi:hypothetical protein